MVVVTKQNQDNTLAVYSIPEEDLKAYWIAGDAVAAPSNDKEAIDLYKMEYERCAQRYDDLYKAAWTNFSYIALISGAILTFGSDSFMTELSIFVAALPLLFWWIASFEPLNRYGDQVQARAACIESLLNELVGLGEPEKLSDQQKEERESQKGLRHFQDFKKRKFKIQWVNLLIVALFWISLGLIVHDWLFDLLDWIVWICGLLGIILLLVWGLFQSRNPSDRRWREAHVRFLVWDMLRVRFVVRTFAGAILIIAICSGVGAYKRHGEPSKEAYMKRNPSSSQLPERLNIKNEK